MQKLCRYRFLFVIILFFGCNKTPSAIKIIAEDLSIQFPEKGWVDHLKVLNYKEMKNIDNNSDKRITLILMEWKSYYKNSKSYYLFKVEFFIPFHGKYCYKFNSYSSKWLAQTCYNEINDEKRFYDYTEEKLLKNQLKDEKRFLTNSEDINEEKKKQ